MENRMQMNEEQRALVEENLPLVGQTIARHIRYNEDICGMGADDLYQEGCWALCRAAMTYDQAGRGTPFSAYARPVIRNHLLDHCRRVLRQREHLPTVPLDVPVSEDIPPPEAWLRDMDGQEVWDAQILVDQLLEHGRRTCTGVARLGVEALALKVKGYNPINQLVGYIISEDPTYITNYNNARSLICRLDRDELLQELLVSYLGK